jgi:FdhD protein
MKKEISCLRMEEESWRRSSCQVAEETPLCIFLNGRHLSTAMISPEMEEEFLLGHLFSEGIISGIEEVEDLALENGIARVTVSKPAKPRIFRSAIMSGCGGSPSLLDSGCLPMISSELKVGKEDVFAAMNAVSQSLVHRATGGVHSYGLFLEGRALCVAEDIGRHNALDKVVGCGLQMKVSFGQTHLASTGRISSEIALKISRAGVPLVASRGGATSLAVEIAERTGLTIAGFVRGRSMSVYTNPWRIVEY